VRKLIVFASKYGATERCVREIADRAGGEVELADLRAPGGAKDALEEAVRGAGVVAIGGPIYSGRIRAEVPRFCERHRELLLSRRVALFICGLETGDLAREELAAAFPEWLSAHAFSRRILGGEVRLATLGMLDRFLFGRLAGQRADVSRVDARQIEALAAELAAL
jgi:menaquinone-dependent protoporphyrinogen oxidase